MRKRILTEIETLECLYYLSQSIGEHNRQFISKLRSFASTLPQAESSKLLEGIKEEVSIIRTQTKCRVSNARIRQFTKSLLAAGTGFVYISKSFIEKNLFANYSRVFARWPHIPMHALVVFDTDITRDSPFGLFVSEQMLFEDVALLWNRITGIISDGKDFRSRDHAKQLELYSYLRLTGPAVYHFLEAYLNGLAFGFFQTFHSRLHLHDHDLLAEWDSKKKRKRFASLEAKIKEYPKICGRCLKRKVVIGHNKDVALLVGEGKLLRDGLTHPSPYVNPKDPASAKIQRLVGISVDQVRRLVGAAVDYVLWVETALGRDPKLTSPWLSMPRDIKPK